MEQTNNKQMHNVLLPVTFYQPAACLFLFFISRFANSFTVTGYFISSGQKE